MAEIRTIDYKGFNHATGSGGTPGFLIYSGSLSLGSDVSSITSYSGVGIEAIGGSESFLRFRSNPNELDIRTNKFFLGSNTQFISGSDGNIEISSSNFHLDNTGDVVMQGTITAEAGGTIGGWSIGTTALSSSGNTVMLDSDGPYHISASDFQVDTAGAVTASAGLIGGWQIKDGNIFSPGMSTTNGSGIALEGDSHPRIIVQSSTNNYVWLNYTSATNYGLSSKLNGNLVFTLGNPSGEGNTIAGWSFDTQAIEGGRMHMNKEGYISSSGAGGWMISSSNAVDDPVGFISSSAFKVSPDGRMTASAGLIGGFIIESDSLTANDGTAWDPLKLTAGSAPKIHIRNSGADYVRMFYDSNSVYGIEQKTFASGEKAFQLGSTNQIAGWSFNHASLDGGRMHINKEGYISSSGAGGWMISSSNAAEDPVGFISSSKFKVSADGRLTASAATIEGKITAGSGEIGGWTIESDKLSKGTDADYIALIPGTGIQMGDSTFADAPFSVTNAGVVKATSGTVGGWTLSNDKLTGNNIIISSSGAIQTSNFISSMVGGLAGSGYRIGEDGIAEFEEARIRGTLSTAVFEKETVSAVGGALIVANATALKSGSLILSGSIATASVDNAAGFVSGEYILAKATSSTGFTEEIMKVHSVDTSANTMVVSRSMNGNLIQSMSSGQVLVSQGANGTGFILLNATSGSETPYIDIVERTGTGVNDLDIKVRLGDLSGISDNNFGTLSGFGLYTDNVFLKGTISSSAGNIGGFNISSEEIKSDNNNLRLKANGTITGSDVLFNGGRVGGFTMDGHSLRSTGVEINNATQTLFISSSNFKVDHSGNMTGSQVLFTGGKIANFTIDDHSLTTTGVEINDSTQTYFISSSNFKVDHSGNMTGSQVDFTGGTIGGFNISDTEINSDNNNLRLKSNGQITASQALFTGGKIGGWTISNSHLQRFTANGGLELDSTAQKLFISTGSDGDNSKIIEIGRLNSTQFGIVGYNTTGTEIFKLGETGNNIAGFSFDDGKFSKGTSFHISTSTDTSDSVGFISSSNFKVSPGGVLSASSANFQGDIIAHNITEKFVKVTDANSGSFLRYVSGNATTGKKNIVCDGSLGGAITSNFEIATTAAFTLADIELANTGSQLATVDVYITTDGMHFDNDVVQTDQQEAFNQKVDGT